MCVCECNSQKHKLTINNYMGCTYWRANLEDTNDN